MTAHTIDGWRGWQQMARVAPLSATALARMAGDRGCWRVAMVGGA
jgi:hypothetical protein